MILGIGVGLAYTSIVIVLFKMLCDTMFKDKTYLYDRKRNLVVLTFSREFYAIESPRNQFWFCCPFCTLLSFLNWRLLVCLFGFYLLAFYCKDQT